MSSALLSTLPAGKTLWEKTRLGMGGGEGSGCGGSGGSAVGKRTVLGWTFDDRHCGTLKARIDVCLAALSVEVPPETVER